VRGAIIPATRERACALATQLMDGEAVRPAKMVTHCWGNRFLDLVAAVVADALGDSQWAAVQYLLKHGVGSLRDMLREKGALNRTYWICTLSINQHCGICGANPRGDKDPVTGVEYAPCTCDAPKYFNTTEPVTDQGASIECELNKFDDMMMLLAATNADFAQVVAAGRQCLLFSRAWCVAELAAARKMGMRQRLCIHSEELLEELAPRLRGLRVQDMEASRPEDVQEIMSRIVDVDEFNERLHQLIFGERGGLVASWNLMDAVQQMDRMGSLLRFWMAAGGSSRFWHHA